MATLLLNLRDVPEDELAELRALLDAHAMPWYETPRGRFGISGGGLWLRDDDRADEARALLADYQAERAERQRAHHAAQREAGTAETLWRRSLSAPLGTLLRLAAIGAILYLVTKPFLDFGE